MPQLPPHLLSNILPQTFFVDYFDEAELTVVGAVLVRQMVLTGVISLTFYPGVQ